MHRLFITALACLMSVSVFGQISPTYSMFEQNTSISYCNPFYQGISDPELRNKLLGQPITVYSHFSGKKETFVLFANGTYSASCSDCTPLFNKSGRYRLSESQIELFDVYDEGFCKYILNVSSNSGQYIIFTAQGDLTIISPNFKEKIPLSNCIKTYVEEHINEWQKKGEFEKLATYQNRVNEETRNEKIIFFQREALEKFESIAKNFFFDQLENEDFVILNRYDPENESFLIDFFNFGSIVLNVPIDQAPNFKANFNQNYFANLDLYFDNDKFSIKFIRYYSSGNANGGYFDYSIAKNYKYNSTKLDFDFEDLDIPIQNKPDIENISIGENTYGTLTSNQDITFQSSDSTFYINSIAVIPKEIKACDGSVSSADELASFTETNILSHYNVTDRRHLEAILEEHRLQMSGLTLEKTLLESGCIENAQAYLFVQSGCLMGDEMIEIRLVHCETSTLVWSCTGINASPQEVLARINKELSKD